jgi:alpha-L-fucosidase
MRTTLAALTVLTFIFTGQIAGGADRPLPSRSQAEWLDAGIGLFVHWAPNVYQGTEGDNLSTPRQRINPDQFDAASIAEVAKSAKAGYIVFVAKHVGGYCAWQSETTDYSLKTSPWKNGKGDMVADLAKACRQQGLRFGVYLSPRSDIHGAGGGGQVGDNEKQKAYNAIYRRQLTEILTNYGPMFEMWFDGGNVVPVNDLIDRLAPDIITFQGRRLNSTRWVGTEHGFAPYPCWNTVAWQQGQTPQEGAGTSTGNTWCPAECDVSILRPNWFWHKGCDSRILSLNDLVEIYYMSVGRGVNLLLNVTPDDHGAIPAAQVRRLKEFGDEIAARFGKPLAAAQGTGDSLELKLASATSVDHVQLAEDIRKGERVRQFLVEGCTADGAWTTLVQGTQIGIRQLFPISAVKLTGLRLKVRESFGEPVIRQLAAFYVDRPVPKVAFRKK